MAKPNPNRHSVDQHNDVIYRAMTVAGECSGWRGDEQPVCWAGRLYHIG